MEKKNPTYQCWYDMLRRCYRPRDQHYENYGGRGITVCERWVWYENFLVDMGEKPEGMTLGRIDNAKGYSPDNCEWQTRWQQAQDRRPRYQKRFSVRLNVVELAKRTGLNKWTILKRLQRGWTVERAVGEAATHRRTYKRN
jgi:hypothetical protein